MVGAMVFVSHRLLSLGDDGDSGCETFSPATNDAIVNPTI